MANQFQGGETYADGQTVNAARLNNTVNLATALPGLITEQAIAVPAPTDYLLLYQSATGLLKRTVIGGGLGSYASLRTAPHDPAGTGSTTAVMMGEGALTWKITPTATGKLLATVTGNIFNNTDNIGSQGELLYGTGTAPAGGTPALGTAISGLFGRGPMPANIAIPFSVTAVVTGLALATQVWFDIALMTGPGGNAYVQYLALNVVELP